MTSASNDKVIKIKSYTNNNKADLWEKDFGDKYHARNAVSEEHIEQRKLLWASILQSMVANSGVFPKTILEIGAGNGQNIIALRDMYNHIEQSVSLFAVEPNELANKALVAQNISTRNQQWNDGTIGKFDVVFTSGVLIHVAKKDLKPLMDKIFNSSSKYIVCIEYFSPTRRMVPYRGEDDALFCDDYGSIWLDGYPVRCLSYAFFWKKVTGLDNLTFWLFEKVN